MFYYKGKVSGLQAFSNIKTTFRLAIMNGLLRAIRNCDFRSDIRPVLRFWPKTQEKLLR